MKESLVPGIEFSLVLAVEASMVPPHLQAPVLSTPSMIGMIERTCLLAVQPHLDEGETTVGTHISVSHSGPARVGEDVTVDVRLNAITKRRLDFEVSVNAPSGTISTGTHQRAVVTHERLAGKK